MLLRLVTGVAVAAVGALFIAGPNWLWFLALVAVTLRMNHELANILEAKGHRHARRLSSLFSITLMAATWAVMSAKEGLPWNQVHPLVMTLQTATLALAFIGSFCIYLLKDQPRATIGDVATTFLGIIYVGWFPTFFVLLKAMPQGSWLVFWIALGTVASDSGAYFAGRFFGKTPFFAQISPNKTEEGALGGFLLATAILTLSGPYVGLPFPHSLILAVLVALASPAGDLAESLLKRDAGVKDSGDLIPGHGGLLDRLDSLLFNGPIVYFYVATFILG